MTLTEIGGYRLERELGSGGMGVVYLGYDAADQPVAVKVLHQHIANDQSARARLAREVRTLRRIKHPRVAQVYDAELNGVQPFLVTQYVDGLTLSQDVRAHGAFDQAELVHFGHALLDALSAVHAAGVIHRDLKPANVMITNGEPMVIDFGIAHVADDIKVTATGLVMGTPGYLSPELADGRESSEATDWWGWGATVAFAATGRSPFGSGPLEAVLGRVATGRAELDGAPEAFVPLLRACLAPHPEDRPGPGRILGALVDIEEGKAPWLAGVPAVPVAAPAPEGPTTVLPAADRASANRGAHSGLPPSPAAAPAGGRPRQGAAPATQVAPVAHPVGERPVPIPPARPAWSPRPAQSAAPVAGAGQPPRPLSGYGYESAGAGRTSAGRVGALGIASVNAPVPQPAGAPGEGATPRTHRRSGAGGGWAVATLVFLAWAITPFAPIVMVIVAYAFQLVARTTGSVLGRRYRKQMIYGPEAGSGGIGSASGAAIGALFTSALSLILPAMAAAAVGVLVKLDLFGWFPGAVGDHTALLAAGAVGAVVLWLGPGSANLRRGSVGLARGVLRGSVLGELLISVGLVLIGCIAVSSGLANDVVAWWPLTVDPLAWLDELTAGLR